MKARLTRTLSSPPVLTLLILAAVTLGATLTYMALEGWSFLTSLIFTLATITTIGYGNVYPAHRSAELFTAALMIVALAAVAVALSTYAARLITLVARGVSPMEQNERSLRDLNNHIVVVAEAGLAATLAADLRTKHIPFATITQDEALRDEWLQDAIPVVLGDPDDEGVLRQAGIERAMGLIVALASDADNVFVSLSAHDLNPRLRIAARAHAASSIPKLRRSGANEVVLPDQVTAINLVDLVRDHSQISAAVEQVTTELREALRASAAGGAEPSAAPRQILFRALRLALQELSPGMDDTLHSLGRQFGRAAVAPNLTGENLCDAVQQLPALWSSAGLGTVRVAQCNDEAATIEETVCATCQGMPKVGRTVCNLERGVITGALEARLGRTVHTKETKCWGLGDSICEFQITADPDTH
ncbi:MAG: NAD-binding protein [Armatimonadetes bacterium]|nr:NAD-binding protein [Armatimonadota bacterium]